MQLSETHQEYHIEYYSKNTYQEPVTEGIFEFNVIPCNDETQILIDSEIKQTLSESVFKQTNLFGFSTHRIRSSSGFNEFTFHFKARIQKLKIKLAGVPAISLEEELKEISSDHFYIDHHLFLRASPFAIFKEHQFAQVPSYKKDCSSLDYLKELNTFVHKSLTYQKNTTSVNTLACDAFDLGSGVCQDYAHIFITIARHNNIPTRYVSGYLHSGSEYEGASFMHAWVEAYVPGMGWIGFDPTNNILVNEYFIKVSHGADYADCSPLKGVLRTKGDHTMISEVKVVDQ
jgi:hypothetical protein